MGRRKRKRNVRGREVVRVEGVLEGRKGETPEPLSRNWENFSMLGSYFVLKMSKSWVTVRLWSGGRWLSGY